LHVFVAAAVVVAGVVVFVVFFFFFVVVVVVVAAVYCLIRRVRFIYLISLWFIRFSNRLGIVA
jgi:hypothetical protein